MRGCLSICLFSEQCRSACQPKRAQSIVLGQARSTVISLRDSRTLLLLLLAVITLRDSRTLLLLLLAAPSETLSFNGRNTHPTSAKTSHLSTD
jgi:hypothetical protein